MDKSGLQNARVLTADGFYYDNLMKMAKHCRAESDPEKFFTAYVMEKVLMDLAAQLGDRPVIQNTVRKMEFKYRTAVNLALEKGEAGVSGKEQFEALSRLIRLLRKTDRLDQ